MSACGVGLPFTVPSIVRSNRIAPITLPLPKDGEVIIRSRILWMRSNISSSFDQAPSSTPYPLSALGVEPPDWSSAAMKPSPCSIFAVISDWFMCLFLLLFEGSNARKRPPFHPFEKCSACGRNEAEILRDARVVECCHGIAATGDRDERAFLGQRSRRLGERNRCRVERRRLERS